MMGWKHYVLSSIAELKRVRGCHQDIQQHLTEAISALYRAINEDDPDLASPPQEP